MKGRGGAFALPTTGEHAMKPSIHRCMSGGLCAAALAVMALPAWAAGPAPDKTAINANYQRERAVCETMTDAARRTSCLRDAGAARAEALRGELGTGQSAEDRARNAVARCKVHPPERQALCERMIRGDGTVSGSVEGGGVLRELITLERPSAPATTPPPSMPSTPLNPG
jgi:hypothetical protein